VATVLLLVVVVVLIVWDGDPINSTGVNLITEIDRCEVLLGDKEGEGDNFIRKEAGSVGTGEEGRGEDSSRGGHILPQELNTTYTITSFVGDGAVEPHVVLACCWRRQGRGGVRWLRIEGIGITAMTRGIRRRRRRRKGTYAGANATPTTKSYTPFITT